MKALYQNILHGLELSQDFYRGKYLGTFENYLSNLQPAVETLRQAYRNDKIDIDYSDLDIQAAYLLAYYPYNAEMTFHMLRQLSEHLIFGEKVKVCCFGGGPGPEIVALVQFLAEREEQSQKLIANIYDVAAETWSPSRQITGKHIIPKNLQSKIFIKSKELDFCGKDSFKQVDLSRTNLFIFQNCMNELNNSSIFQENLTFLLDNIENGSVVILADLRYDCNSRTFELLKSHAQKREDYEILIYEKEIDLESSLTIPQTILANLLTGQENLIPRKYVRFMLLAIRKNKHLNSPPKVTNFRGLDKLDLSDIPF